MSEPPPPIRFVDSPDGSRKVFRFPLRKTVTPVATATPVDEASVKIIEAQKRAEAEAQKRTFTETQERTFAEAQKRAEPLPLSAEERSQKWKTPFIAENAKKLENEDSQKRQELTLQQRMQQAERNSEARGLADEKTLINAMHELEVISRYTPVYYKKIQSIDHRQASKSSAAKAATSSASATTPVTGSEVGQPPPGAAEAAASSAYPMMHDPRAQAQGSPRASSSRSRQAQAARAP